MLVTGNCIISDDVKEKHFCCDISVCRGLCCVEGDYGAPITKEEKKTMEKLLPDVLPMLSDEKRELIEKKHFWDKDDEGSLCTRIVNGKDCVFVTEDSEGTKICAIQKLYMEGKTDFIKPVSCHLYPIRLEEYDGFTAVNVHVWDICRCAFALGREKQIPVYKFCREALIRRFGEKWYSELCRQIEEGKDL